MKDVAQYIERIDEMIERKKHFWVTDVYRPKGHFESCEMLQRGGDRMAKQNVYDNDIFYENFINIRSNEVNFNNCIETPILLAMLPDLHGKTY